MESNEMKHKMHQDSFQFSFHIMPQLSLKICKFQAVKN